MDEEAASKKQDTVASSGSDVAKSMDVILSEEDREKKLVYLFMLSSRSAELEVISLDPHKDSGDRYIDKTLMINKDMPPDLRELWSYNIAALGSKIYFIGGEHRCELWASNKVFAFDTDSENWVPSVSCLNRKRSFSVVVTYENRIYLFGNQPSNNDIDFTPRHWAEVYHSTSDTWEYLPGDPPEDLLMGNSNIVPAVVKHKKMLLICLRFYAVYAYSLDKNCWLSYIPQDLALRDFGLRFDDFGLRWSITVAVMNNTLFWECFGCIFAYDFQPDTQAPVKTYTLPNALETFGKPSLSATLPVMTFLVNAGNGKLCLVYSSHAGTGEQIIRCHIVELKKKFELHGKGEEVLYYPVRPRCLVFAMAMDRGEKDDDHERRQKCKKKKYYKAKIHKDKQKQCVENGDWKTHKEIAQLHSKPKDNAGAITSGQQNPQKSAEEEWKLPKKTARAMTALQAKDKGKLTVEGPTRQQQLKQRN